MLYYIGLDKCMITQASQVTWFDPWVEKLPWRRKWQPTEVFLPGEFHGQRSLVGHNSWGHRVGRDLVAEHTQHMMTCIHHWYHTEYFHGPKSTLCSAFHSFLPFPTPNPWEPLMFFIVCRGLPFAECHIVGIMQYVVYSDWLRLVICIYFPIVFSWPTSSFFF